MVTQRPASPQPHQFSLRGCAIMDGRTATVSGIDCNHSLPTSRCIPVKHLKTLQIGGQLFVQKPVIPGLKERVDVLFGQLCRRYPRDHRGKICPRQRFCEGRHLLSCEPQRGRHADLELRQRCAAIHDVERAAIGNGHRLSGQGEVDGMPQFVEADMPRHPDLRKHVRIELAQGLGRCAKRPDLFRRQPIEFDDHAHLFKSPPGCSSGHARPCGASGALSTG